MTATANLSSWVSRVERAADRRLSAFLRRRPGWSPVVLPYIGYGTAERVHVRARVLASRRDAGRDRAGSPVLASLAHYFSVEIPGEEVSIEVAGRVLVTTSGPEGYVEATLDVPDLSPGWHDVTFAITSEPGYCAQGQLIVVDPDTRLGIVSDIDDTIIHTGLTRLVETIRTSLFVHEHDRTEIAGASELYRAFVAGADGRAQFFYVSTGAWNLYPVVKRFLVRHDFPEGPVVMTDWGPGGGWLFREASAAFKTREITELLDEHPHLTWVLIGDSGQDDPEAYAAVARAYPKRVHAVYIRDVPPKSPFRTDRVRQFAAELEDMGVRMLLVPDSAATAADARDLGLIDAESVDRVRAAVEDEQNPSSQL